MRARPTRATCARPRQTWLVYGSGLLGLLVPGVLLSAAADAQQPSLTWISTPSHSRASFRGLGVAPDGTVWVGGTGGTVLRSTDGGRTWETTQVPDAAHFDFRGVAAIDAQTAYVTVAAFDTGRIYKTTNAGRSWQLQYRDERPGVFLDGIACWTATHCFVAGDPVGSRFPILLSSDAGAHWTALAPALAPEALPHEAVFAASGTTVVAGAGGRAWIATGSGLVARVWRSTDFGRTWHVAETPLVAGTASTGAFSLALCDSATAVVVGGDYRVPAGTDGVHVATSADGGATWTPGDTAHATPYLSGAACRRARRASPVFVAVGPSGTYEASDGVHWTQAAKAGYNAVALVENGVVAVGADGATARAELTTRSR